VVLEYTVKDSPKVHGGMPQGRKVYFRDRKRGISGSQSSAVQTLSSRRDAPHVCTWNCIGPKLKSFQTTIK
jgi:hypothetical protein